MFRTSDRYFNPIDILSNDAEESIEWLQKGIQQIGQSTAEDRQSPKIQKPQKK